MPPLNLLRWSCDFYPKSIYVLYVLICLHWAFPGPLKGHRKWYYQGVLNSVSKYFIENFCRWVQDHFKPVFFAVSLSDFDMRVIIASLKEFIEFLFFLFYVWKGPYPLLHSLEIKQIGLLYHSFPRWCPASTQTLCNMSSWTRNSKICQSKLTSSIHNYIISGIFVIVT